MNAFLAMHFRKRRGELKHGLRIVAGGVLSFALAAALGLPQGYWAVFTAVLVVQGSVGGSWKAAVDRLIGTLLGAMYGAIIATVVRHDNVVMLGTALAISLAPLALLAAARPSYRVAPLTAVILLLGSGGADEGPFAAALLRSIEVSLGGFVGLAVSLLVLPARAHALLGEAANVVLQRLADLFGDLLKGLTARSDADAILVRNDAVRIAITKLEEISDEAARERRNFLAEDADPEPVTRTLRRARHDMVLIGRVAAEPLPAETLARLRPALGMLSEVGTSYLRALGKAFAERAPPPEPQAFNAAIDTVESELQAIKDGGRVVALGFALEQLQRNLRDLARRAEEFALAPRNLAPRK